MELTKFREFTWNHNGRTYFARRTKHFRLQFIQQNSDGSSITGEVIGCNVLNHYDARIAVMSALSKGDYLTLDRYEREAIRNRFDELFGEEQKLD